MRKSGARPLYPSSLVPSGTPSRMMPPTKPVEVAVVRKNLDPLSGEEVWEPYQEYGVKTLASTKDWSCYILAKEREVSVDPALNRVLALMPASN